MVQVVALIFGLLISVQAAAQSPSAAWPLLPEQAQLIAPTDLTTGSFYYHYLTENYQAAVVLLEQMRQQFPENEQASLDVLEVTLLLALGLDEQAATLFSRIRLQQPEAPRAWLYLARRWQARGDWPALEESAKRALAGQQQLHQDEQQEALYLLLLSQVEQEKLNSARLSYSRLQPHGYWAELGRYNLLVAQIRSGTAVHAVRKTLTELHYYASNDERSVAIQDRANVIVAMYLLEHNQHRQAENVLNQVQLQGTYSAEALLFKGWTLFERGNYQAALQPWRVLQQDYSDWHPAVVESVVAVPHAMELLHANTQALRSYELVAQRLHGMLEQVQQLQQPSELQQWLTNWLEQQQGEWGWRRHQLNLSSDPLSQTLLALFSTTSFRHQLAELYDIQRIQHDLQRQDQNLELWQNMLEQRIRLLEQADGVKRLQQLEGEHQRLEAEIGALNDRWKAQQGALFSYASAQQKQHLQRLERVVEHIQQLQLSSQSRHLDDYKERWRRTRGTLLWQMVYHQSAREWASTHEFWQLQQGIADMQRHLQHSTLALQWSASRWQNFAQPLAQAKAQVQTLQQQSKALQQRQQQHLLSIMQHELALVEQRLNGYQAHVRLAIARLYDDALQQRLISAAENLQEQGAQYD